MIIIKAKPCEDVEAFAERLQVEAWTRGATVYGEFNEHTFEAHPKSTVTEIMAPYTMASYESYFGKPMRFPHLLK